MSYLGQVELKSSDIRRVDVTSSTSATHTLTWTPPSEQSLIVTINGVKQQNNYTISGTTLTLDSALVSSDELEVVGILDIGTTNIPADDSITNAMVKSDAAIAQSKLATLAIDTAELADDAVTADKLANAINTSIAANTAKVTNATHTGDVTGATALTIATDAVDIAMLSATGTASSSTFLRGDNAWTSAGLSGWSEDGGNNDLLPASASAGIYLGVSSATASNLLDDYEEGTWTPAVTASGGSITTVGAVSGVYTKVGRVVTVTFNITITTNGTGSGQINIGSVPFAASGTWIGAGRENAATGKMQQCNLGGTSIGVKDYDDTYPGANGRNLLGSVTYSTA